MMRRQRLTAWSLAATCGLGVMVGTWSTSGELGVQSAWAQDAGALGRQIDTIQRKVTDLENRYLKPELIKSEFSAETRFNDAKVAYVLKQYDQASVLFLDVVTRTTPQSFSAHRESLYMLADSLFQMRNFVGARNFLGELTTLGPGPYFQEGLAKLLEIAYLLNDYSGIDEIYGRLDAQSAQNAAVSYLRGKTLYQQGRYNEAVKYFEQASADKEFSGLATYYAGVADVSQKRLAEARSRFERLVKAQPQDPRAQQLYYLAYLALGRLDYEEGKYDEALLHYNKLPRTDPNFINAIYEATWALVQQGKFREAQENIEVLIWDDPSPQMYTKAMLLKADLSLRIKDFDVALNAFQDVLDRYDPVKAQMEEFAAQHADLPAFFASLVQENLEIRTPESLPSIKTRFKTETANDWLSQGKPMKKARALTGDLGVTRAEIDESYRTLAEIDARIESATRVKSFPAIAEGLSLAVALESEIIAIREAILAREAKLLSGVMTAEELQIWQRLRQEHERPKQIYATIPKDPQALEQREKEAELDYRRLRRQLDDLTLELDRLKAEQRAINTYIQTQELMLAEEAQRSVDEERAALAQEIETLEADRLRLRKLVDIFRQQFAFGAVLSDKERSARADYRRALADQSDFLAPIRGRSNSAEIAQLDTIRKTLPAQEARLAGYTKKMTGIVEERVAELKIQVNNERTLIQGYDQTIQVLVKDSREVVGQLAYRNFMEKRQEFAQIILRADVGKIDVLFQRKEEATQEINTLFQDRTNELKALQESFEDVRE